MGIRLKGKALNIPEANSLLGQIRFSGLTYATDENQACFAQFAQQII
jgi:hypothetical protein